MKSDFTFVLHCAKCGLNGEIEEYTLRYQCPECGSEMRLSRIKTNISGEPLRTRIRELLSAKARGDGISGRIFALLADSSDPEVRKLIDDVLEEKYCRDHGIATPQRPTVKLEPEVSGRSATEPMSMDMAHRDLVTVLSRWTEKRAARKTPSPPPRNAADHAETGYSEVTCPYCGAKKVISNSFLGLHTRCRCGWTFPTSERTSTPAAEPKTPSPPPRRASAPKRGNCWRCDGTGIITTYTDHPHTCHICNGTGIITPTDRTEKKTVHSPKTGYSEVSCPYCGATKIISDSYLGLHTQCRCGRTFPTSELTCTSAAPESGTRKNPVRSSADGGGQDQGRKVVVCPYCGTSQTVSDSSVGLYAQCRCGHIFPTANAGGTPAPKRPTYTYTAPTSPAPASSRRYSRGQKRLSRRETEVTCPYCGAKKVISNSFLGLHTQCPKCGRSFPTHD